MHTRDPTGAIRNPPTLTSSKRNFTFAWVHDAPQYNLKNRFQLCKYMHFFFKQTELDIYVCHRKVNMF